jgi:hypothetical protein
MMHNINTDTIRSLTVMLHTATDICVVCAVNVSIAAAAADHGAAA